MSRLLKTINVFAIITILLLSSCTNEAYRVSNTKKAKNVILIIGDGMGLAHLYGAMSLMEKPMNVEKASNIGFSKTHSSDNYITDSAASGTAMATGKKTRNGILGLGPDSTRIKNLTEIAHKNGRSIGVVSSSAVTHATPASFVAHNISRNNYYQIAEDFIANEPDVFIGGGKRFFTNRPDGRDLIKELEDKDYDLYYNVEDLLDADSEKMAALLADEHMPKISQGRGDMLSYGAIKAIQTLSKNENGFFLMIEASQIDWAAHDHDTKYIVEETIDLDRTLGVVLDYAKRIGETLVIVTADHETGGMTLVGGDKKEGTLAAKYSVGGHTGIAVPVFAFGPAASYFTGFYENTEIFEKIVKIMDLK